MNLGERIVHGIRVRTDATIELVAFEKDASGSILSNVKNAIGAQMLDVVRVAPELDMWADDEGLIVADPQMNPVASVLAARAMGMLPGGRPQPYFGDVVFLSINDQGDSVSLTSDAFAALFGLFS